jgi:hypothetical protein
MDSFERRGNDAQSAQRHAGSEDRFGRGVADERERRREIIAAAARYGLTVKWRYCGIPGANSMEPERPAEEEPAIRGIRYADEQVAARRR